MYLHLIWWIEALRFWVKSTISSTTSAIFLWVWRNRRGPTDLHIKNLLQSWVAQGSNSKLPKGCFCLIDRTKTCRTWKERTEWALLSLIITPKTLKSGLPIVMASPTKSWGKEQKNCGEKTISFQHLIMEAIEISWNCCREEFFWVQKQDLFPIFCGSSLSVPWICGFVLSLLETSQIIVQRS